VGGEGRRGASPARWADEHIEFPAGHTLAVGAAYLPYLGESVFADEAVHGR
jgi:hypothetical protein